MKSMRAIGIALGALSALCACASPPMWRPAFDARCNCESKKGQGEIATFGAGADAATSDDVPGHMNGDLVGFIESQMSKKDDDLVCTFAHEPGEMAAAEVGESLGAETTRELQSLRAERDQAKGAADDVAVLAQQEAMWVRYREVLATFRLETEKAVARELKPSWNSVSVDGQEIEKIAQLVSAETGIVMPKVNFVVRKIYADILPRKRREACMLKKGLVAAEIAAPFVAARRAQWLAIVRP
jgi:hypothetical protein